MNFEFNYGQREPASNCYNMQLKYEPPTNNYSWLDGA